jgi:AcrR family transcriptional regulator
MGRGQGTIGTDMINDIQPNVGEHLVQNGNYNSRASMRMASQRHHREQVRQRIIQSALLLFNRHGFAAASIDDIMAGAGMTRGGFYSYFRSKSELYAEAISCFATASWKTLRPRRRHRIAPLTSSAIIFPASTSRKWRGTVP